MVHILEDSPLNTALRLCEIIFVVSYYYGEITLLNLMIACVVSGLRFSNLIMCKAGEKQTIL